MHPRRLLLPLREMVFQVTKRGRRSSALVDLDFLPKEKREDVEEDLEFDEEEVDGVDEEDEGVVDPRRRLIAAGRRELDEGSG